MARVWRAGPRGPIGAPWRSLCAHPFLPRYPLLGFRFFLLLLSPAAALQHFDLCGWEKFARRTFCDDVLNVCLSIGGCRAVGARGVQCSKSSNARLYATYVMIMHYDCDLQNATAICFGVCVSVIAVGYPLPRLCGHLAALVCSRAFRQLRKMNLSRARTGSDSFGSDFVVVQKGDSACVAC